MIRSLFPEGPDPEKAINQGTLSKQNLNQFHKGTDKKLLRKNIQHPPIQGHLPRIFSLIWKTRYWNMNQENSSTIDN